MFYPEGMEWYVAGAFLYWLYLRWRIHKLEDRMDAHLYAHSLPDIGDRADFPVKHPN
jgi:hypothetical protein